MRLLFFWKYKYNWGVSQYSNGYNFSDKCRFEIVPSVNFETIQLNVIKCNNQNIIPNDFFYVNNKRSNISQVNAIVGKNGAGKSTLLKRIAFASLQPYENDAFGEICIEVVDFGDSIKIYYCDCHNITNQQQRNTTLFITDESKQCLSELFGCNFENILSINMNGKSNENPITKNFTVLLISNNDDYLGDYRHSKIENEYYKEHRQYYNAHRQEEKKEPYKEYAAQITNQAIDFWGEKYYKDICTKGHYSSYVIDAFMEPVYKQCVLQKSIYNWLYLDFIFRYFISNDKNVNNSDIFGFYSAGRTLFSLIGIRKFYYFMRGDNELKNYIQYLIDKKQEKEKLYLEDSLLEEKKTEWLHLNKRNILESGYYKIYEICKNTGYNDYKSIQQIYFEIIFIELREKYRAKKNTEDHNQAEYVLDILRFNLLCEFCVHFDATLKIIENSDSLEKAIDYIYSNIDNLIDSEKMFPDTDKTYYLKAKEDLDAFSQFITDNAEYADFINVSDYNSGNVIPSFPIFPLDKKLVNFFTDAFNKKAFFIKYFSISRYNYSSGERRLLDLFSSLNAKLNPLIDLKLRPQKNILLLIDDFDRDCHPEWQLKLLNETLKGFNDLFSEYNFHIVFSTHSPLMITDIPKSYVICLESINNMFNVENININIPMIANVVDIESETFGANIYDLYKDSFFLNNIFTGDFAKNKINNAIKIINTLYEKKQKGIELSDLDNTSLLSAKYIINLIGEPVLRNMLNDMILQIQEDDPL